MIPVVRMRAGSIENLTVLNSSLSSKNSSTSRSKTLIDLLSAQDIAYIQYLAEKERNPDTPIPADITVTKDMEMMEKQIRNSIKQLVSKTGIHDVDLKHLSTINPIMLRKDVMLWLLSSADDLQTNQKEKTSGGGLLSKFRAFGRLREDSGGDGRNSESNSGQFMYLPLALFETMHHASYNHSFTQYRHMMDILQLEQTRLELTPNAKFSALAERVIKTPIPQNERSTVGY
jgi:hypothetical protein